MLGLCASSLYPQIPHGPTLRFGVFRTKVATRSACYSGPKPQNCPKWLGGGAKGVFLVYVDQNSEVSGLCSRHPLRRSWNNKPLLRRPFSTPNMTGRRFHRTTEVIPRRPWKSKSPFAPRLIKITINKGTRGVRASYDAVLPPFISIVRSPGRPVISVPDF